MFLQWMQGGFYWLNHERRRTIYLLARLRLIEGYLILERKS